MNWSLMKMIKNALYSIIVDNSLYVICDSILFVENDETCIKFFFQNPFFLSLR